MCRMSDGNMSWIIALVAVYCLPLLIPMATAQFDLYLDSVTNEIRFRQSLACRSNTQWYTERDDVNCCYRLSTRNKCCERSSYDFVARRFTSICKCAPEVTSCQRPTQTTPTTTTPTTPTTPTTITTPTTMLPPRLFCPVVTGRVLNSVQVPDTCGAFPGVFRLIQINPGTPPTTICNAVLAQAVVNGNRMTTLVTSRFCTNLAAFGASSLGDNVGLEVSPTMFVPYSRFTKVEGRDGASFLTHDASISLQLTSVCGKTACGLRNPEMVGRVAYTQCHVLSYGSYKTVSLDQQGLRKIPVRIYPQGCRDVTVFDAENTLCFTTKEQVGVLCSGDYGAPVFCKSTLSDEQIVVGVVAGTFGCDAGRPTTFGVVQYPTY